MLGSAYYSKGVLMKLGRLMAMALMLTLSPLAFANELDNEGQVTNFVERVKDLPPALVIRVNSKTNVAEIAESATELPEAQLNATEIAKLQFQKFAVNQKLASQKLNELDTDAARASWYFYVGYYPYSYNYWGSYYYPTYYYYGYNYNYYSYYGWSSYGWNYYCYRPYYGWY